MSTFLLKKFRFPGEAKISEKKMEIRKLMPLLFWETRHGVGIKSARFSCI